VKKAWKYTLAAVGIPLLCFGGLALDSYYRALSAIAAHDARLASDILSARMGYPRGKNALSFEDGHSGPNSARLRAVDAAMLAGKRRELLRPMEEAQVHFREGGYVAADQRYHFEIGALRGLQGMLNTRRLLAEELRELYGSFDRVRSARPTVADIITGEHLLDRIEVLNEFQLKRNPYRMIRRPPGWRELFSWRILISKTLLELDEHYRQILPLASLPYPEAQKAASEWATWREKEEVRGRTVLRIKAERVIHNERLLSAEWELTRLALALSLFQAEKGRDPQHLNELIPDYLPSLPVSPYDGAPYYYRKGVVQDSGLKATWISASK